MSLRNKLLSGWANRAGVSKCPESHAGNVSMQKTSMRRGMSLFHDSLRGSVKREGKLRRRKIIGFSHSLRKACFLVGRSGTGEVSSSIACASNLIKTAFSRMLVNVDWSELARLNHRRLRMSPIVLHLHTSRLAECRRIFRHVVSEGCVGSNRRVWFRSW